jgi:hypothetical protein
MKWFTEITTKEFDQKARLNHRFYFTGSCFAVEVYQRFANLKLDVRANSHGIIFHPIPLSKALLDVINNKHCTAEDLIAYNGMFHVTGAHGFFSSHDADICLQKINESIASNHLFLQQADWCILTFGTAAGYQWKENGEWVANCHKIPGSFFDFGLASLDNMIEHCTAAFSALFSSNPKINCILSVSPVRYLNQGYRNNTLSKATLQLLVEELQKSFPQIHYFPAFELFMDEMRDYRFYGADMVHPTSIAVDDIFEKLCSLMFHEDSKAALARITQIKKRMDHRPIHTNTLEDTSLLGALSNEWEELIRSN